MGWWKFRLKLSSRLEQPFRFCVWTDYIFRFGIGRTDGCGASLFVSGAGAGAADGPKTRVLMLGDAAALTPPPAMGRLLTASGALYSAGFRLPPLDKGFADCKPKLFGPGDETPCAEKRLRNSFI